MARRALLMAGAGASGAGLGAAGSVMGASAGAGSGFMGASAGAGSGAGLRRIPHPAQALVEPARAGRCAFHQLVSVRALHGGEFRPEPISGPLHLLKGGASRQCVSRAHGGEQALVRSHSARRGRHRRREGKRGDGAKSGCRRQKTLYKSTLVSTLVVAK